jgi:hypothetical protein
MLDDRLRTDASGQQLLDDALGSSTSYSRAAAQKFARADALVLSMTSFQLNACNRLYSLHGLRRNQAVDGALSSASPAFYGTWRPRFWSCGRRSCFDEPDLGLATIATKQREPVKARKCLAVHPLKTRKCGTRHGPHPGRQLSVEPS